MAASLGSMDLDRLLFEKAKSYLMNASKDGVSVYDQLTRLMELLLDDGSENVSKDPSNFNDILHLLQKHAFVLGESTAACNEAAIISPIELQRLQANRALFERPQAEVRTTIEQPDPYTTVTTTTTKPLTAASYESVVQHNYYWAVGGCGLSEEEAFFLDRSITKLAMTKNLEDVRFVGKIFGTTANYLIISSRRYLQLGEKIYKEVNTMPLPPRKKTEVMVQPEPAFVGVNRLSFWVTSHPSNEWILLPDLTPQQIDTARRINCRFTGNLDADVVSSPPFPWKELVYLRAQLARILSGTFISPIGALEEPEEEPMEEDEDEYDDDTAAEQRGALKEAKYIPLTVPSPGFAEDGLDVTQFASLDQWVHAEGYIYSNGRQTKVPEKPEEEKNDDDDDDDASKDTQKDEVDEGEAVVEEEEEEERELFAPIRLDHLYAVIDIPQPPPVPDDDEEEEEEEEEVVEEVDKHQPEEVDNSPLKPLRDEDVPDNDITKIKQTAWKVRLVHNTSKNHRVVVVHSLRWPGAIAYAGDNGRCWGCVYFGTGLKKTDFAFTPTPAPPVLSECADLVEVMDPTAAVEKLVRRGEEPPENDSEEEFEEGEEQLM